jgi:hypothetical protein
MDMFEFVHQVTLLLKMMRDPKNKYLGKTYTLNPRKRTLIESLVCQAARQSTDSRTYTTKLVAKPCPETEAWITMPLLNKLEALKMDGPGAKTRYREVEYRFVVEVGEPRSPTYSSSSSCSS